MAAPTTIQLGSLKTHVYGDLKRCRGVIVLCHGFGAPGTDLIGVGPELFHLQARLQDEVAIVFPEAPIDLGPSYFGGRAWWEIEVGRFSQAQSREALLELVSEVPPGLKEARRLLRSSIDAIMAQSGHGMRQILLGGFSQGSMLATDVTLRAEEAPAALCIFSGAPVALKEWAAKAPLRQGLKVLQTHGQEDAVLPFFVGEALRDLLLEAGLDLTFMPFQGPHTISGDGLARLAALAVARLLDPPKE